MEPPLDLLFFASALIFAAYFLIASVFFFISVLFLAASYLYLTSLALSAAFFAPPAFLLSFLGFFDFLAALPLARPGFLDAGAFLALAFFLGYFTPLLFGAFLLPPEDLPTVFLLGFETFLPPPFLFLVF